ncbi:MAG: hypothetical protein QNJ30_06430 [Kiloniellales bacterium]|nr:hypothetical protein [Kiloniellales bacterium]
MKTTTAITAFLLILGLATNHAGSMAEAAEPVYINSYGSDWGLWARGHCRLDVRADVEVLEIEAVALEPNRNYPQTLEIAGFRLSAAYLDKTTGEPFGHQAASGPRVDYAVGLAPGEKHVVKDLILRMPRGRPPGANEARVLILQILVGSGSAFEIEIARTLGN